MCKRTVQKYMRRARPPHAPGPRWSTFLREQAKGIWACDFLQLYDAWFRLLFAFFLIDHATRRGVHFGVTPTEFASFVPICVDRFTPTITVVVLR